MSANFSDAYATTERGSEEAQRAAEGFVTIQVPFALPRSMTPGSQFEGLFTRVMDAVPPRTIFASYASVERAELFLPAPSSSVSPASVADVDEANALHGRRIRWTMATTSDAGGNIPKWVQRNWTLGGVPRAVVADVGLFIDWTMKRRERRRLEDDAQVEEV